MNNYWFWGIIFGSIALSLIIYLSRSRVIPARSKSFFRISIALFQAMVFTSLMTVSMPFIYHFYDSSRPEKDQPAGLIKLQDEHLQQVDADLARVKTALTLLVSTLIVALFFAVREFPVKETGRPMALDLNVEQSTEEI